MDRSDLSGVALPHKDGDDEQRNSCERGENQLFCAMVEDGGYYECCGEKYFDKDEFPFLFIVFHEKNASCKSDHVEKRASEGSDEEKVEYKHC